MLKKYNLKNKLSENVGLMYLLNVGDRQFKGKGNDFGKYFAQTWKSFVSF
jgi:hypothetical protein